MIISDFILQPIVVFYLDTSPYSPKNNACSR